MRRRFAQPSKPASGFEHPSDPTARPAAPLTSAIEGGRNSTPASARLEIGLRRGGIRRLRPRSGQRVTRSGEPKPLFEAEHPGRMSRRELSDAEADDHARSNPDARPQRGERTLKRKARRIRERRFRAGAAEHLIEQRSAPLLAKDRVAPVDQRPRHRLAAIERLRRGGRRGARVGVHERGPGRFAGTRSFSASTTARNPDSSDAAS